MLIHIRDDEHGGALCELANARPLVTARELAALRPPSSSSAAACAACIVAGDFYLPDEPRRTPTLSAFVSATVASSRAASERRARGR